MKQLKILIIIISVLIILWVIWILHPKESAIPNLKTLAENPNRSILMKKPGLLTLITR